MNQVMLNIWDPMNNKFRWNCYCEFNYCVITRSNDIIFNPIIVMIIKQFNEQCEHKSECMVRWRNEALIIRIRRLHKITKLISYLLSFSMNRTIYLMNIWTVWISYDWFIAHLYHIQILGSTFYRNSGGFFLSVFRKH